MLADGNGEIESVLPFDAIVHCRIPHVRQRVERCQCLVLSILLHILACECDLFSISDGGMEMFCVDPRRRLDADRRSLRRGQGSTPDCNPTTALTVYMLMLIAYSRQDARGDSSVVILPSRDAPLALVWLTLYATS